MMFKTAVAAIGVVFLAGTARAPQWVPDQKSVSAEARKAYASFWKALPREKADTLERELTALETRARRGETVDRDLEPLRREYPEFFKLSTTVQSARWIAAGGGTSATCTGILFIGRNGRTRCIGSLKTG
jgi:hypothetical protein